MRLRPGPRRFRNVVFVLAATALQAPRASEASENTEEMSAASQAASQAGGTSASSSAKPTSASTTSDARWMPGLVLEQEHFSQPGGFSVVGIQKKVDFWFDRMPRVMSQWKGALRIETGGEYSFELEAIGGARLKMDGKMLVDLGSNQTFGLQDTRGSATLAAGYREVEIQYKEALGEAGVVLKYQGPDSGNAMEAVPASVLFHRQGPCDLTKLPHIAPMPCKGRWALDSGESCEIAGCAPGFFPVRPAASADAPAAGVWIACNDGEAKPSGVCGGLECRAPTVAGASADGCKEGIVIGDGLDCTPVCMAGLHPGFEGPLKCTNGTFTGSWFDCHAARPCTVIAEAIPHSAVEACEGGNVLKSGDTCKAQCEDGYLPVAIAGASLSCTDGLLDAPTATGPAFRCDARPTTQTSTTATTQTTTSLAPTTTTMSRWEFVFSPNASANPTTPEYSFGSTEWWLAKEHRLSLVMALAVLAFLSLLLSICICAQRQPASVKTRSLHSDRSTAITSEFGTDSERGLLVGSAAAVPMPAPLSEERLITASWRPASAARMNKAGHSADSTYAWGATAVEVPWSEVSLAHGYGGSASSTIARGAATWSDVRPLD